MRLFMLYKTKLSYYRKHTDVTAAGFIPLDAGGSMSKEETPKGMDGCTFSITPKGVKRKYLMVAKDEQELQQWMESVRRCLREGGGCDEGSNDTVAVYPSFSPTPATLAPSELAIAVGGEEEDDGLSLPSPIMSRDKKTSKGAIGSGKGGAALKNAASSNKKSEAIDDSAAT
jgi:hypothetical protein